MEQKEMKFAVLIDADNISEKYVKIILDETASNGIATYKRIYGDWTSSRLASWKNVLLNNSIIPIQQYGYTTGKNATDSAMIIDAMDILYSNTVNGFCIVSSDSDFTRLAARLRESGMHVIGMGESKTPKPFISACNQYKYLDLLYDNQEGQKEEKTIADDVREAIRSLAKESSDEDDWITSSELGNQLAKRFPDFDVRNFGYSKFTPFIRSLDLFEIKRNKNLVYVKLKS